MEHNLILGNAYSVKHVNSQKSVLRIFKGTEKRFDSILCYVFSSKVKQQQKCVVDQLPNGVKIFNWKGTGTYPKQEISIPYYDLREVKPK